MGKSKRVVTLKIACVCGRLGAVWSGNKLYCSNTANCGCLIREKGKDRIPGSLVAIPQSNEGSKLWREPITSYQAIEKKPTSLQIRSIDANRWPIALDKHDLAKELFKRFGCGNGLICDDDSCTLC